MALFGPKDKNLPRLTTFFQVEPIAPDEEAEAVEADLMETEFFQWLVREKGGRDRPPFNQTERECLGRLAALHGPVRRLMMDLHERRLFSVGALKRFSALCREIPDARSVRTVAWPSHAVDADGWVKPQDVHTGSVKELPYDYNVAKGLTEDLIGMMRTPEKFLRCEECQSIFVARREQVPAQRFCSHRCADRQGTRLRRRAGAAMSYLKDQNRNKQSKTKPLDSTTQLLVSCP